MKLNKKKIVITGGEGRFARSLKNSNINLDISFPNKKKLNILSLNSIERYLKKIKPKYVLHAAGLSRPMNIHDKKISKSIDLNIIGTANVVKICEKYKIKLIYFSTNYIYPGKKGNYKETDAILPINNYAWSKLGGESSVKLYENSLILRLCITEKPFIHKSAFKDAISSFLFVDDLIPNFKKIIKKKGIINIGGERNTIYKFAKKSNPKVKPVLIGKKKFPKNSSMNINKFKNILK